MKKCLIAACLSIAILPSAHAAYNNNMSGKVTEVLTYPDGSILFSLENQLGSFPNNKCNPRFFSFGGAGATDIGLNRMFARLLLAKSTQENINIGFDDGTAINSICGPYDYIKVERVG